MHSPHGTRDGERKRERAKKKEYQDEIYSANRKTRLYTAHGVGAAKRPFKIAIFLFPFSREMRGVVSISHSHSPGVSRIDTPASAAA